MGLLYALRFLTIIPVPYKQGENMAKVGGSAAFFPVVGLLIGTLLFGAERLFNLLFIPEVNAALICLLWIVISGGLHLDGLADLADGLGGGRTKEEKLSIMKDSRSGAFGVLALVILVLLKWSLIIQMMTEGNQFYLILIPMSARWITMNFIVMFPSARKEGMGSFFKKHMGVWKSVIAGIFTLTTVFILGGLPAILICLTTLLLLGIAALIISRILGGLTGDAYGSLIETGEVLMMLLIPVAMRVLDL